MMAENDKCRKSAVSSSNSSSSSEEQTLLTSRKGTWIKFLIGDVHADDDPQQLSMARKQLIIFVVALSGISGPLGSMIYMPGLLSVADDLHTSMSAVNGSVSAYVVFMGLAPLVWASLSDQFGRKRMYLLSTILGIVASIICAVSTNIAMLIVFRAVQAAGLCASQSLGAGVIADTIPTHQRGRAYGFFYIGPLIGPTVGGVLCQFLGWQSTFYFQAILGAVLLAMIALLLPETLRKKKNAKFQEQQEKRSSSSGDRNIFKPFLPLFSMLQDPTMIAITSYSTVIFGCLYLLNPTITDTFQMEYGYNQWQVGLTYLAFGVGLMIGSVLAGRNADWVLRRLQKRGAVVPEMRLRAAFPSFFLIPAGYLIYGWTVQYHVGAYAPIIGLFVYALGQMSAFTPSNVYLVDSQPGRSASAVAINNCFRSIAGAITAIFSTQALHGGGPGILYTILAAINVANIGFVVMCMIYGQQWRQAVAKKRGIATPDADTSMEKKATAATTDKDDDPELGDKDSSLHQQQQQQQEIEHTLARTASRHSAL
ncbi:hypothetical protein VTP01DRAFT_2177 [Rhizomucor pusillus]|uniref:uncharacterized protein n=1 Tax=Rhizomucor pusillus TaxID=4840 RepID=UPI003741EACE